MAFYARTVTSGNGTTQDFPVSWPYLSVATVQVYVVASGVEEAASDLLTLTTDYTFTSGSLVHLVAAPGPDQEVVIQRSSPSLTVRKTISSGTIASSDLNQDFTQLLYLQQEAEDRAQALRNRAVKVAFGATAPLLPSLVGADGKVLGVANGEFVFSESDGAAIAGDRVLAEEAATATALDATATAADRLAITTLIGTLERNFSRATDSSVISTTALTADPDLAVPILAGQIMKITWRVPFVTGGTGDFKYRITGPAIGAGRVTLIREVVVPGGSSLGAGIDVAYHTSDVVVDGSAGAGYVEVKAFITNGATAGTINFSWGANASEAVSTTVIAAATAEVSVLPGSVSFALASTGIAKLGRFPPSSGGGHNYVTAVTGAGNSYLDMVASGTKAEFQLFGGISYTYTVDGGSPLTLTPSGGTWVWVTLPGFTGLSDTAHRLTISGQFFDADATLRITGIAPTVSRPSDVPQNYILGSAPFTTYGASEAVSDLTGAIYGSSPSHKRWLAGAGFGLKFKATTTSIRLWMYNGLTPSRIIVKDQSGSVIGDVTPTGLAATYEIVTLVTGLSGSHEYEITFIQAGRATFVDALLVDSLDAVAHTARPITLFYGDSLAGEVGQGATFDTRNGAAYLVAQHGGRASALLGTGGAPVHTNLRDGTAVITAMPVLPSVVVVLAGTNDMAAGTATATVKASAKTMLTNIRAIVGAGIPIHWPGIFPRTGYTTQRLDYNTNAIQAAISELGDAAIYYHNTDGWFDPALHTIDGTHPNNTGEGLIAAQLEALGL